VPGAFHASSNDNTRFSHFQPIDSGLRTERRPLENLTGIKFSDKALARCGSMLRLAFKTLVDKRQYQQV
jgi:hypothetical protein